jgi:GT2 family glycosyltransferase
VQTLLKAFPDLQITRLATNIGYTGGNNVALRRGLLEGYDYVIIVNQDVEIDPCAVRHLVETADLNPDAGIVGGVEVADVDGSIRAVAGTQYSLWFSRARWSTDIDNATERGIACEYVQGALVLISRRVLELGLLFDQRMFMYCDEADLGYQLKARGLKAYVDLRVIVRHKNDIALNILRGYLHQRNRAYLVMKYGQWYHKCFYLLYTSLCELPAKIILRCAQRRPQYAWACVKGHLDGMFGRMSTVTNHRWPKEDS